jgi:crotonobetainyl-CoA:carnitine CoA-transferase CaiB-like acyl-CoA transferase
MANLDTVRELLTPYFLKKTRKEWMALMEEAGIPAGPILDTGEMFADEQTRHRNMVVEVEHSSVGKIKTLGPAVKLSKSPTSVRRAAPRLGEHSAEVLAEFGYSDAEIGELLEAGVVELPAQLQSAAE